LQQGSARRLPRRPTPASTTGTRTASAGGNRALVAQHPARSLTMSRDDAENAMWWMPTP
jgi:hypothetical protein